ncbi:MAG TPA: hypothetical protein VKG25_19245 [Bryobacteraceae bacterium]|nr:hypothetical protein [Bryobacteraceae bacterium]
MRLLVLAPLLVWLSVAETVSLNNGLRLKITPEQSSLTPDLAPASGNSFYRIFRDFNNLAVFAYELQIDRSPDGNQFQVTAKPVLEEFEQKFPLADGGKPTPTFSEPIQSDWLKTGERFVVNVPINPGENGGNLADTIEVRIAQAGPGAPPDRSLNGALHLTGFKVKIGGRLVSAPGPSAAVAGRYVMFYIPGKGGYFLSSDPVDSPAFTAGGSAEGTTMRLTVDNENLECAADAPIMSGGHGQLWVFHDPAYKPQGSWTNSTTGARARDEFFMAGADSLKWWLR